MEGLGLGTGYLQTDGWINKLVNATMEFQCLLACREWARQSSSLGVVIPFDPVRLYQQISRFPANQIYPA